MQKVEKVERIKYPGNQGSEEPQKGINLIIKQVDLKEIGTATKISTVTSDTGIIYYTIQGFTEKYKISDSTIRRRISSLEHNREKWRYVINLGNHYLVSCGIVGFNRKEMLRFNNNDYSQFLRTYTWDLAGTARYSDNVVTTEARARERMEKLFKSLKRKYPKNELVFFYVTEENPGKDGFHSHFVLGHKSELFNNEVKKFVENRLRAKVDDRTANTLVEGFRIKENWIEYMVKQIHKVPEGYNWLDHNLFV